MFRTGIKTRSAFYTKPIIDLHPLLLFIEYKRGAFEFVDAFFTTNTVFFNITDVAGIFRLQLRIEKTFPPGDDNGRTNSVEFGVRSSEFGADGCWILDARLFD
jgi:hypothetical protein